MRMISLLLSVRLERVAPIRADRERDGTELNGVSPRRCFFLQCHGPR